ncbi:MAG TPA: DUF2207 domain-containing protein [Gemmatimonadales bacterium]|nr:DUF2207 domain-containing protein [Gemmatimonadales bacterium]
MIRPALVLLLCLAARPAAAQRSLAIERFSADIAVGRDGTVDVSETITARFSGSWNGIYRTVPVEYRTPQGFNWTLDLELVGATDGGGRALEVERERVRHFVKYKIWVPGARDTTRTVVLRYRARNGLRFFEDHDELYWNVTGDEWDVPIGAASARIALPAGATGVRATSFNGVYGATAQDAEVVVEGTAVRITLLGPLGFREGLTAVVGWDKGVVAQPTAADRARRFLSSNWPLAIPIPVLLVMFLLWRRVGRDPRRLPVAVRYEPPDALTPAEAGTLMDYSADMRDITATLVDLAVRGHLRIEEREERVLLGLITKREYVFHRLAPPAGAAELGPHESRVLGGIFQDGTGEVKLSDLDNEFYRHLPRIRDAIFERLVERGLYRSRPDRVRRRWTVGAFVLGGVILWFGITLAARLDLGPLPFVIAAFLSGLIVAGFARIMPARTVQGTRALERVLGFEEFLRRVDGERLERVVKTPEMFERFLPFAMAFGVERKWARAFRDIYREPPGWYVGSDTGPFDLGGFSSRLGDLSSRAESAMTSSPRSSGGSGFSGGSSGGGSGGGGGGGF